MEQGVVHCTLGCRVHLEVIDRYGGGRARSVAAQGIYKMEVHGMGEAGSYPASFCADDLMTLASYLPTVFWLEPHPVFLRGVGSIWDLAIFKIA